MMKVINNIKMANNLFKDGWTKADKTIKNGKEEYILKRDNRIIIVNEDIYNIVKGK